MPAHPWLAHCDRGVPATLAPYANETPVDRVSPPTRTAGTR